MHAGAGAAPRWRKALAWLSVGPALVILLSTTAPWWPGQLCANWSFHAALLLLPAVLVFGRRPLVGAALIALLALACVPWIRAAGEPRAPLPAPGAHAATVVTANV